MIKEVKFPSMRSELIVTLLDLQDVEYQEKEWFLGEYKRNFDFEFGFVFTSFEDLDLFNCLDNIEKVYADIGVYLKSKEEAERVLVVARLIWSLFKEVGEDASNEQYRNSKYLTPLREAAKEAYDIFMENEKDNKEFLDFIEKVKELRNEKMKSDTDTNGQHNK